MSSSNTRPTFLVIGAAKSGSTSLCRLLGGHPDVFMTSPKELHFFSFDEVYARGREWYESWYADGATAVQRGEGSQSYSVRKVCPDAARRIHEYSPDLKLIYIVRNPLQRIQSLWSQLRHMQPKYPGGTLTARHEILMNPSFDAAVREQPDSLVESSNYWQEINVYRKFFDDRQILVLFFEEFIASQEAVMKRCFEFLGVDPSLEYVEERVHLNKSSDHMQPGGLLSFLRSTPRRANLWNFARGVVPKSIRTEVSRRFLRSKMPGRPEWNPTTLAWVADQLQPDMETFLEFYGRPRDFWSLEKPS